MDKVIEGLDIEQIGSPGSVISLDMAEADTSGDKKQYATIKGEIKTNLKSGQKSVVFREGQHYMSRMTEQTVEMVKIAILEEHNSDGGGVDSKKVLEAIRSTIEFLEHGNPTVKDMRSGNPKGVQLLFHMDEMIRGSSKIKKIWARENKPASWPVDVPFEDPNNGSQTKKERAAGKDGQKNDKLKKEGLGKMYAFLRREYIRRKEEIQQCQAAYMNNLPSSLCATSSSIPRAERLVLLHHRTHGLLLEAVSKTTVCDELSKLLEVMFTRSGEGERMRILFGEVCLAIQRCIDIALLKDKIDSDVIKSSLREILERYRVETTDNSVQQVSTDTPECYTGLNGFHVQPEGSQVLPSPGGNDWNHLTAQQALPEQSMMYQPQQPQQQFQQQSLQQQPHQSYQQPQSVNIVTYTQEEKSLQQQLKQLRMDSDYTMIGQPSTTMDTMCNTNAFRQTPPLYGNDMDYTKTVLINDVNVSGKRKHDDDGMLSSSGKIYASLEPPLPRTDFTTGQIQTTPDLQFLLDQLAAEGKVSVDTVTPTESIEVNQAFQLFAQETVEGNASIGMPYMSTVPERMDIDQ